MGTKLPRLIPVNELARTLGLKPSAIHLLCKARRIPHIRIGRRAFFEEAAIEAWLDAKRRPAATSGASPTRRAKTYAEECEQAGVSVDHRFA